MTDQPQPEDPGAPSKGRGIGLGVLAALGAVLGGFILGAVIAVMTGGPGVLAVLIVPIALLVVAGLRWREIPGFLLGIGIAVAVSLVVATGCTAYFMGPSSPLG